MKKLILAASLLLTPSAFAETGIVRVENNPEVIQKTVDLLRAGKYRGHLHDSCDTFARRSAYSVTIGNGSYRVDRYGNLQWVEGKAIIKYSCNGSDD